MRLAWHAVAAVWVGIAVAVLMVRFLPNGVLL